MTRLFTGDFSTGDYSQWSRMVTSVDSFDGVPVKPVAGSYSASIVSPDPDCGYAARMEVRSGGGGADTGHRVEFMYPTSSGTYAATGQTVWYAMSYKFDETFPDDRNELGWGSITQWKPATSSNDVGGLAYSVLSWGWAPANAPGFENGYFYLLWIPQSSPGVATEAYMRPILKLPLNQGEWHDIKMRVYYSQGNDGTVQVWHNGTRKTFEATYGGGGTTFTGQTVAGGSPTGANVHLGHYRDPACTHTDIVYFRGFRMADSEDSL